MTGRGLAIMASMLLAAPAAAGELGVIAGTAKVIDGDSLTVAGAEIRLEGIDAFEWDQSCGSAPDDWPCGAAAKTRMKALAEGRTVLCQVVGRDRYKRAVAFCRSGETDLGRALVREGLAVAYRKYSMRYAADEDAAKAAKVGAWAGRFAPPWQHRRRRR